MDQARGKLEIVGGWESKGYLSLEKVSLYSADNPD